MTPRVLAAGRRPVAAALLLSITACMTLQPVAEPRQFIEAQRPASIWVTTGDGDVALNGPRIYLDSLYGFDAAGGQVWLALDDIRQARARQASAVRTGLLLSAIFAGVLLAGVTLGGGGDSRPEPPVDVPDLRAFSARK